jgi:hypothetical protein
MLPRILRYSGHDACTLWSVGQRIAWSLVIGLSCVACGPDHSWLPLDAGRSWFYIVNDSTKAEKKVYPVLWRVGREIPVAGSMGRELTSELGVMRLAWKDSTLYMSESPTVTFAPAIPLFGDDRRETRWKGLARWGSQRYDATARVTMTDEKIQQGTHDVAAKVSTVLLSLPNRGVELKTWFVAGTGIVRQEQRINNVLTFDLSITQTP